MLVAALVLGLAHRTILAQLDVLTDRDSGTASKPRERVREGTMLNDVLGTFKLTGDRATFFPADGSARYGGLENQALERVANVIGEDPEALEWLVSGTVTEYKGNNYLLVSRAILKSKPSAIGKAATKPANATVRSAVTGR
jgi:hypothetical protein